MKAELTIVAALISFVPICVIAQSARPMMKAAVVQEYGGAEVFKYDDVPRPWQNPRTVWRCSLRQPGPLRPTEFF
jgi:hypothetical protein